MRRERDSPNVMIHQVVIVGDVREVCVDDGYGIVEYWKRGGEVACRDAGLWRGQYICKWAGALIGLTRTKIGWMVVRHDGLGGYRVTRS